MKKVLAILLFCVVLATCLASIPPVQAAGGGPDHWLVTEWGSALHNFKKVADRKYEDPRLIAGNKSHYWVYTRDGSVYYDGSCIENKTFAGRNVVDMAAWGPDYYLLMLEGNVYRNGKEIVPAKISRARKLVVRGSDMWILDEAGQIYKNGAPLGGRNYIAGYYPDRFAVWGDRFWFSISAGSAGGGGMYIYNKDGSKTHNETWLVRSLFADKGAFYIFSGKSVFKDFQRIEKYDAEVNNTGHADNTIDFRFVPSDCP